jgi:hypothetical protein
MGPYPVSVLSHYAQFFFKKYNLDCFIFSLLGRGRGMVSKVLYFFTSFLGKKEFLKA